VPPAPIESLAPARYKVQFTAGAELREKLDWLRALMRSSVPDGDLAAIIDAAVTEKLERLEARRFARTRAPRKDLSAAPAPPSSRHVPAAVRRCRAHNALLAEIEFGRESMERRRRSSTASRKPAVQPQRLFSPRAVDLVDGSRALRTTRRFISRAASGVDEPCHRAGDNR